MIRRRTRRWLIVVAASIGFIAVVALVLFSPIIVERLALRYGHDWKVSADVGQAYGAAGALVSALALSGVAVSLIGQWRVNRATQFNLMRERHFELVRLALEYPNLAFPEVADLHGEDAVPMVLYANLWLGHWRMGWEIGEIDENGLRDAAMRLFSSPTARAWWSKMSADWGLSPSLQERAFIHIVSDEYRRCLERLQATSSGRAVDQSDANIDSIKEAHSNRNFLSVTSLGPLIWFGAGAAALAAARALRRRRR